MKTFIIFILILLFPTISYSQSYNKIDIYWLTQNIYWEARGETPTGQVMVGLVTLERLDSGRWGDTIKSVVTYPDQFSWYWDDIPNIPLNQHAWNQSKAIALFSLMIHDKLKNHKIMHYHNDEVLPYWAKKMDNIMTIGKHKFYVEKN